MKKQLPIGLTSLEKIIEKGCVYIDKTHHVANLVQDGDYYFLSRPRRFGKSLFIDTLKQAFLGNKELFKGLYLENAWDWNKTHPVIHLSFSGGDYTLDGALDIRISEILQDCANEYGVILEKKSHGGKLGELINKIRQKVEQAVVILVDEYDKPILDAIDNLQIAVKNRQTLKGLYGIIKENDANLRFVFLTGVSKFSKVNLFSDLNNLNDLTLDARYADICGYTQDELDQEFAAYISAGNIDKTKLKLWYNGYNFAGTMAQKVYNPFDILLFFDKEFQYKNYWFETGNPAFLIKLLQKNCYYFPNMENVITSDNSILSFDIDNIPLTTLLFQTGYLTIKEITTIGTQLAYVLSYPNLEVKTSLNDCLAKIGSTLEHKEANMSKLMHCLSSSDLAGLSEVFKSYFASIPHDWYRNNHIQDYEGFYASIVYSYFCALGYTTIAEDTTSTGRIDLTVELPDKILILEFKLKNYGNAASALQQIKKNGYANKYKAHKKLIYLVGISFDADTRNVYDFICETM